jgi:hypothetical protein
VKKIIFGLGLVALLSGCLDTGLISVLSSDVSFTSNYTRTANNKTEQVICRNKNDTILTLSFGFNGRLADFSSFRVKIFGSTTADSDYTSPVFEVSPTPSAGVTVNGNVITVQFGFPANTSPYSSPLKPQAVVVTPVPVNTTKIGSADLRLTITDVRGTSASSNFLVREIPVYSPCP